MALPRHAIPALLLGGALLVGCGSSTATPVAGSTSPAPASSASALTALPATGKIAVNKLLTDPVLGDSVRVLHVVRRFPVPATLPAVAGKEIVLVEIRAQAGKKFNAGILPSSFSVLEPSSPVPDPETTALVRVEMAAAGYPPFPASGVASGKRGTGWLAFQLEQRGATGLELQLVRAAARVSGSSQTIPRKAFTVPLPDPRP